MNDTAFSPSATPCSLPENRKFALLKKEGSARRGVYMTAHGPVQTPVFMNVGTQAAIMAAFPPGTWGTSDARWNSPTPTISMSVRGTP